MHKHQVGGQAEQNAALTLLQQPEELLPSDPFRKISFSCFFCFVFLARYIYPNTGKPRFSTTNPLQIM